MSIRVLSKLLQNAKFSTLNQTRTTIYSCLCNQNQKCYYSSKPITFVKKTIIDPDTGLEKKRKTTLIPRITLLTGDNVSITTLDEAQKISKRRGLKLVKVVDIDTKTQRPVYKLMTGSEYHAEDLKQRELRKLEKEKNTIKGDKVVLMTTNISEHDLLTHRNKIAKWLAKQYDVRVVVSNVVNNNEKAESIYSNLESGLKDEGRFLQKRFKGNELRFQIIPPKKTSGGNDDGSNTSNASNL